MESAEHLALALALCRQGVQVLLWENKTDLIRALLVLRATLTDFPNVPVLMPNEQVVLQEFSIKLFEGPAGTTTRRFLLIPQASTETIGKWLNGWRQRLSDPPGTMLIIRRSDYAALCRRAPDLMSFAQSDVHETTGLLPLIEQSLLRDLSPNLPSGWYDCLNNLPGELPTEEELSQWTQQLRLYAE